MWRSRWLVAVEVLKHGGSVCLDDCLLHCLVCCELVRWRGQRRQRWKVVGADLKIGPGVDVVIVAFGGGGMRCSQSRRQ
ncbi:hypothetical protein M0R45_014983 [Rubus argutus]|uniref:Secreted protein n=1 Tax=Rubus argutus TaxID=59490 RepID=A0AAW1XPH4_RUBAR